MSTRALIGKINKDGVITTVYNHSDGYLEHLGTILNDNITADNVSRVIRLGYISYIGTKEEIKELASKCEELNDEVNKYMKAYYNSFRDIPNTDLCYESANPNENTIKIYADKTALNKDLKKCMFGVEYVYLLDMATNTWKYIKVHESKRLRSLSKALKRLNKYNVEYKGV